MKLLLLAVAFCVGLAVAVGYIGKAQAQFLALSTVEEASTHVVAGSTVITPATLALKTLTHPPADMTKAKFKRLRYYWHSKVESRRWRKCVHHAGDYSNTAAEVKPWFRQEAVNYWHKRAVFWKAHSWCWERLNTGNFDWMLERAAKKFNVSYSWIHNCAHDEGDTHYRGFIMNSRGSGAGGWMQFMSGTFYDNVGSAFLVIRGKGMPVPLKFKYWTSKVGQAVTASYMFYRGWSSQWTGASCN